MTLEELMARLGIPSWPERWEELYPAAMQRYDKEGCIYADPDFYDRLDRTYRCFPNELDTFRRAAAAVREDDTLARYLMLLSVATCDREFAPNEAKKVIRPRLPSGCDINSDRALGYEMVTGLAVCAAIPDAASALEKRGFPADVISDTLTSVEAIVNEYRRRHDGRGGFHLYAWAQLAIDGRLFNIGRLQVEFPQKYSGMAQIFADNAGAITVLADDVLRLPSGWMAGTAGEDSSVAGDYVSVLETDDGYTGHTVLPDGRISDACVTLSKTVWRRILRRGDPAIHLHIPPLKGFSPETVDETMKQIREFIGKYAPEYAGLPFTCESWMLDPFLAELAGEGSNIVNFGRRFRIVPSKSHGNAVFYFIFLHDALGGRPDDISALAETTTLMRNLKRHYLNGGAVKESCGFFLW